MYKLLVVDDEELIRTGFQTRIDWSSLGFEFLTPCADGRQAIEAIEAQKPDVVLTDIAMPFVDGLELSTWLAHEHPEITVLVLSGYDDFEFARTTFRNRVFDYLLKPVTAAELTEVFRSLRTRLDERGVPEPQVRRLLAGEPPSAQGTLAPDLLWKVVSFEVWEPEGANSSLLDTVLRTEAPETGLFSDRHREGQRTWLTLLFFEPREDRIDRVALLTTQKILNALLQAGWHAAAGLGSVVDSIPLIPRSRSEAQTLTARRLAEGSGLSNFDSEKEREGLLVRDLEAFPNRFAAAVKALDRPTAAALTAEYQTALKTSSAAARRLAQDVQSLFTHLADLAGEEAGEEPYHIAEVAFGPHEITKRLEALVKLALDKVARGGATLAEQKVAEFQDFVELHYQDLELSIHEVSHALTISPGYLSKIVKKHLHRSFVEYVTEFRVARAKELLAGTDLMTYEIAEKTGYPDSRYFSSIFKKLTGATPSEFRQGRRRTS